MKELYNEKVSRDGLLEFLKNEIEFISDNKYSWSEKYIDKDGIINNYKSLIKDIELDDSSKEYLIKVFKEKDGDITSISTSIQEL